MPPSPAQEYRIAHWQAEVSADFEENFSVFQQALEKLGPDRIDILSFPECFLNGYYQNEEDTRKAALSLNSKEIGRVVAATEKHACSIVVGVNEQRGDLLFNTALVLRGGKLLGTYSKCTAYMPFHERGTVFPVFEHDNLRFGVLICSDGGYIEPARILALKGAALIVAPHYNYVTKEALMNHYLGVRNDHRARATENSIWFLRANNVVSGRDEKFAIDGVGYGDSYLVDPRGEIIAQTQLHTQGPLIATLRTPDSPPTLRRSFLSSALLKDTWLDAFQNAVSSPEEKEFLRINSPSPL